MTLCRSANARRAPFRALILAAVPLSWLLFAPNLHAQSDASSSGAEGKAPQTTVTIFLNNITDRDGMTELQGDLRTAMPNLHVYGDHTQRSVTLLGTTEEIDKAQKLIAELDKPRRAYRVTYTITDSDSGKPAASKHVTLVIQSGSLGILKQGTRIPLVTGATGQDPTPSSSQVQYIDIGLYIDASLESAGQTIQLHTKIEQSSVADEKSGIGTQDPVIRQTQLDQTSVLTPGKPLALGSLDLPDTSRREEVEVVAELIR